MLPPSCKDRKCWRKRPPGRNAAQRKLWSLWRPQLWLLWATSWRTRRNVERLLRHGRVSHSVQRKIIQIKRIVDDDEYALAYLTRTHELVPKINNTSVGQLCRSYAVATADYKNPCSRWPTIVCCHTLTKPDCLAPLQNSTMNHEIRTYVHAVSHNSTHELQKNNGLISKLWAFFFFSFFFLGRGGRNDIWKERSWGTKPKTKEKTGQ